MDISIVNAEIKAKKFPVMTDSSTRRKALLVLILFCYSFPMPELRAQAIIAPGGRTLFNGATLVRSFARIDRFSLNAPGVSVDSTRYITPLALVYGIYPKWSVIVAQPYVNVDITRRVDGGVLSENLNGFADTQFFLQYDGLYSRNAPGGLTRLAGVFGVQAPTGADRFSTGAFAYTGGLIFEKQVRLKYLFTADFEYTFATENSRGMSVGDQARFDAVPGYFVISGDSPGPGASWIRKLYDRLFRNGAYLLLEFNGGWQGHAQNQEAEIANSGSTTLSISPGIQYFPSRSLMIEFSSPIPVVKALNGLQPKPTSSFLFGFRYLF